MTAAYENDGFISSEVIDARPICIEQMVVRPQPVGSEPTDSHLVGSGPILTEAARSKLTCSRPANSVPVHSELPHAGYVVTEPGDSRPPSFWTTHSEHVHLQQQETMEQVHSEMAGSEASHSLPVSVEGFHSGSLIVEYETSGLPTPQPENMDVSDARRSEADRRNLQAMISEHAHSHESNRGFMTSELVHSQSYDTELVRPHLHSSQIAYAQTFSSELVPMHPGSSELVLSHGLDYEPVTLQPTALKMVNSQVANPEPVLPEPISPEMEIRSNKGRKKKSVVWEHFTIESVGNGCRRAFCKVCRQSFAYSTGSKVAGTSHLKRHIAKGTCPAVLRQQENKQLTPCMPKRGGTYSSAGTDRPKKQYRSSSSPSLIFKQDKCRHDIARMIIMHDYPLHIVDHPGFIAFVQNLQPCFNMVDLSTVQGDCLATYMREKQNLENFINGLSGHICLAVDVWSSCQSTSYVFLTGQFVDDDWRLHRRLLNVVMEPFPESETAVSHAVATCLSSWSMENKLFSITVHQPLGNENLRTLLSVKNPRALKGQLIVSNCLARTLSSMALDALAAGEHAVKKVRSSVMYVTTSDSHESKFLDLKLQLDIPVEKTVALDNLSRWDTTYRMLLAAADLKEVFSCLETSDPEYKDAPTMEEWKRVESLCNELKQLYKTASLLAEKNSPPPTIFFHEVWKIQLELAQSVASDDPFERNLAKRMQEKFKKYWEESCLVLAITVAMDPRFKMKLVEFSFTKIFGEQALGYIKAVDEGIHETFQEYETLYLPQMPAYVAGDGNSVHGQEGQNFLPRNELTEFDMYMMETSSQQSKSELDQYLEECLLPRVQEFDVLDWWKQNRIKYPNLSKMAGDIFAIQLSTVGPDFVFDTVGKEMDPYQSSLRPEILEALVCAKDWLRHEPLSFQVPEMNIVKMEV